jgi:hypothetical protein
MDRQAKERMVMGGGDKKSGVENLPHPIKDQGKARDQAGKALGVSGRTVDFATKVLREAEPDIVKAVDEGRMAVSTAAVLASEAPEIQKEKALRSTRIYKPTKGGGVKPKTQRHIVENGKVYDGGRYADMAIAQLERIEKDDPQRDDALMRVFRWVKRELKN